MIENTSRINQASYSAFQRIGLVRRLIPMTIGFELLILAIVLYGHANGIDNIALWIYMFAIPVFLGLFVWLRVRHYMRNDKRLASTTMVKLTFHDDGIDHESHGPAGDSKGCFPYASFHHATITKKYVFLYQNLSSAYPVERAGFTQGSAADMVALLKRMGIRVVGRL